MTVYFVFWGLGAMLEVGWERINKREEWRGVGVVEGAPGLSSGKSCELLGWSQTVGGRLTESRRKIRGKAVNEMLSE
jgi:hypothetical protein